MRRESLIGIDVIAVGTISAHEALALIQGCDNCTTGTVALGDLLNSVMHLDHPSACILTEAIACPRCQSAITETTRVRVEAPPAAPTLSNLEVVLVDDSAVEEAQSFVSACELCSDDANIAFDYLLDALTGCNPAETEYLMSRRARCPSCSRELTEKTLVVPV